MQKQYEKNREILESYWNQENLTDSLAMANGINATIDGVYYRSHLHWKRTMNGIDGN